MSTIVRTYDFPSSSRKPVAIVAEHSSDQGDMLIYKLEVDGFSVVSTTDGSQALTFATEITPDILILDWELEKLSGIEICRQLKATLKYQAIPIILLSTRSEEADRVCGLEAGADDYVVKPYSVVEILARVRAKLRHTRPSAVGATIEFNEIKVDTEAHRVFIAEKLVHLGPTEFRLLAALMEKPGLIWSREQLLDRVWGRDVHAKIRTVDMSVNKLRKAIGQDNLDYPVRTVKGSGYSLG